MAIEACLDLLRHASNLAEAYLRIWPYDSLALPNAIIPLPQLHSLNLSGASFDSYEHEYMEMVEMLPMTLLKCLKAPALKALALGFESFENNDPIDISPFLSFVSQSSFQLDILALSLVPQTADALIKCLKATPSVIRLKLQISYQIVDADPLFVELTSHRDFLPKLESLSIALSTGRSNIDALVVANMLFGRCILPPVTRLQSFRFAVTWDRDLEDSIKSDITGHPAYPELEASGIDLGLGERYFDAFMHLL
jgi:hypothetical protein